MTCRTRVGLALTLGAVLGLAGQTAHASLYRFDYSFGSGPAIHGTMTGTASGSFLTNVSNFQMSINGVDVGPLTLHSFWANPGTPGETPFISFVGASNNFWLSDPNAFNAAGNDVGNGTYGFALIGANVNTPLAQLYGNDKAWYIDSAHTPAGVYEVENTSWSLTEVSSVPEPSTAALLAIAALAAGMSSRQRNRAELDRLS